MAELATLDDAAIRQRFAGTAIKLGQPRTEFHRAPRLGEHTVDILRQFGLDEDAIDQYLADDVVAALHASSD